MPLATVRAEGLQLQRGGVGFYPTSGSPFVHMDTGTIRHWPRIAREELVKIFPNGRTVHIPADGHPLPGYALALADVERQGAVPSGTSLEAAREAGVITASEEQAAAAPPKRSLLARIFDLGKGHDKRREEQSEQAVASLSPSKAVKVEPFVPLPAARPNPVTVASILPRPRPAQPIETAAASDVFDNRGYWPGAVDPGPALPAPIANGTRYETASLDQVNTASTAAMRSPMPPSGERRSPRARARWARDCRECRRKQVSSRPRPTRPCRRPLWLSAGG